MKVEHMFHQKSPVFRAFVACCGTVEQKNAHIHQLCTGIYMFIRYLYNLTRVALYAKMFHSSTCVSQVPNYLSF